MGALALKKHGRALGAMGGIGGGLVRRAVGAVARAGARSIPGLGTIMGIASIGTSLATMGSGSAHNGGRTGYQPTRILPGGRPFHYSPEGAPKGYHVAKNPDAPGPHGKLWPYVRNRRMNPLNGRAAKRAIRRISGAKRMLKKIFSISGRPAGKITPKSPKRRS